MSKKTSHVLLRTALAMAIAVLLAATCFASDAVNAVRTSARIYLNDSPASIVGYEIGGNNYFKLRDLAYALKDTTSSFDLAWNAGANRVEVYTQRPYAGVKEENPASKRTVKAVPASAELTVDGKTVEAAAYEINGNNYYKLRDLSELFSFSVHWLEESGSICIYTLDEHTLLTDGTAGSTRQMSAPVSTERWSHLFQSYIYEDGGDVFYVVEGKPDGVENAVVVDAYDRESFVLLMSQEIPIELDVFGGFFAGETYNYMVFGQDNEEENNKKEVIRIVKYDKDFNRLESASITGGESFTVGPFAHGSLRMAENGSELVIHTSRKRYTTEDGVNHQSQLTIRLDTDTMQAENYMGRFQDNHVSHSFNQFVIFDEGQPVLVDHGDAYPRSIVLSRANGSSYAKTDLLKIPGELGANCTGVTIGGFEASASNYLVAINAIDHSKVSAYDNFNMTGLDQDERDVVLLVQGKDGGKTQEVRLTDYIGVGKLGSTPYLVKLSEDRFLVLWEEYVYGEGSGTARQGVRCVEVDGDGETLTEVQSLPNVRLSSDCQPVFLDGAVTWYVNAKVGRMFYQIEVED